MSAYHRWVSRWAWRITSAWCRLVYLIIFTYTEVDPLNLPKWEFTLQLFPREMEITSSEGFTHKSDIFGRKGFGDQLTRIVRALESPSVILLDAPWGTGKTTFVKMWRGELAKSGIPSIYFDAFANDYQDDAFLAVASQIIAEAETLAPRHKKVLKTFKTKALSTLKVLGRAAFRVGIHAATAGIAEGEALEKAAAEAVKNIGDESAKAVDDTYESVRRSNLTIEALLNTMRFSKWRNHGNQEERSVLGERVEKWWRFCLGVLNDDEEATRNFTNGLAQYGAISASSIIPHFCNLVDGFALPDAS
jgi:hypothetical protein